MRRFIEGQERTQVTLLPECLEDYVGADNAVRVVDVFVDQLDLRGWVLPASSRLKRVGRPTTLRCCSRSISTATSIVSSLVAAWSARLSATSS